jgi:hypothetical protein
MGCNLQGSKFICARCRSASFFYQTATAAPTVYLPIGSDRHLDLQIDRLFAQTGGTPLTKPYAISEIQLALEKIKHSRLVL